MPLLVAQGMHQGPFLPFPNKLRYMWHDLERRAKRHGLPYRRPSTYPPNTLLSARIGVLAATQGWCQAFTEETFRLHWVENSIIGSPNNIAASLSALGKSVSETVEMAERQENKDLLKAQTERAKELGLFGSPSFVIGEELFWGDDRLDDAMECAVAA